MSEAAEPASITEAKSLLRETLSKLCQRVRYTATRRNSSLAAVLEDVAEAIEDTVNELK